MTELVILLVVLAFALGWKLPEWIGRFIVNSEKKRMLRQMTPSPVEEYLLCDGPHEWTEIASLSEDGTIATINACDKCGLLAGRDAMVSQEALRRSRESRKRMEFDEKVINEFSEKEEGAMKAHFAEELKNGLDYQKLLLAYKAGQTLQQRYILYRIQKLNELEKPTETTQA